VGGETHKWMNIGAGCYSMRSDYVVQERGDKKVMITTWLRKDVVKKVCDNVDRKRVTKKF
jgi:hypothetical protein